MSRIEELEKRLAADPNSRMFVQLAEEYRKQGLLENAIEICEQGLTKHPQYPSARVALGRALLEAETFDRASEEFEAVLAQVPDNILANKFLGETYHRLGRYDEAIQKYQIAQTLAPEDAELEEKIEAVKAEQAGGGPPPPAVPEPADETAVADPAEYTSQPPVEAKASAMDPPLEPTLVDARPVVPDAAPPPVPGPSAAPASEVPPAPDQAAEQPVEEPAELAPIPLVEVDEPMVLESASESYARAGGPVPDPAPPEPVLLVSPAEPPPITPAAMEPPPVEPPSPEPPPLVEPAALEPPPMEPPSMEPPPVASPPPPPLEEVSEAMPVVEPLPVVESLPVEPLPVEPAAPTEHAAEPTPAGETIETPTMAELYASQGHFDKAVLVYRNLLMRDPNETQYLERIEELEMLANATADATARAPAATSQARGDGSIESGRQQTIEVLEQWLDGIRRSREV